MFQKTTALVCVVLGATLSIARADTDPNGAGAAPTSAGAASASPTGNDQLTLPKGRLIIDAYLGINLSSNAAGDSLVGKPVSISPDIWYGVNDDLTVGLVHSTVGTSGIMGGTATSLCLTGKDNGCANVYNNVGVDARYRLPSIAGFTVAADVGLFSPFLSDPMALGIKLGAVGRWQKDKLSVDVQPNIFLELLHRTVDDGAGGSTTQYPDVLTIPVTVNYLVIPKLTVSGQLGFIIPLEETSDQYAIPLSIGAHYALNESVTLTAALTLNALVGGDSEDGGFDNRAITLGGTYAF
jgi:hypothetical protein